MSNRRFVNRRFSQLNDERRWHARERSPSKCCNLPDSETLYFVGKSAKRAVTSGWRALTDGPTSLVIQLRKPSVNTPPVRHSKHKSELNRHNVESRKINSEWRIQIATCLLQGDTTLRTWNRTIQTERFRIARIEIQRQKGSNMQFQDVQRNLG